MEIAEEDLEKIKEYLPASSSDMTLEVANNRFYVQTFIVADNLVNMGLGRWGQESLKMMPAILPGIKLMIDHGDEVAEILGVLYDVQYIRATSLPPNWILDSGGERNENLSIIAKEGYARVEAKVYISKSKTEVVEKIESGEWDSISLTFSYDNQDYLCPKCESRLADCRHVLKSEKEFFPENSELIGHYIKPRIKMVMEASIVYRGLNPATGLKTKRYLIG